MPFKRELKIQDRIEELLEEEMEAEKPLETKKSPKNWLQDYELYDEENEDEETYGISDPSVPASDVPCPGCGALLHCIDGSIPGYLPSELFKGKKSAELKTMNCQRCHFLINYDTAINVTVNPEDYIKILSTIKDKFALAILMVDLLDFPCSIWPGITEILGRKRPIFLVGNKVDLLPKDSPDYLNHIKDCLKHHTINLGFQEKHIKHVALISAKTGYGVEELITKLHDEWKYKGDVYLIGCTNVGKSSLFNALLRSDYCKVEASNIIQKATASIWPGTTLKMLKFPILRPSDHRVHERMQRLASERQQKYAEEQLRRDQANLTKKPEHATLIGHIGRTFIPVNEIPGDQFSLSQQSGFNPRIMTLNEKSEKYKLSKWCFDTPGVVQPDQILNLLTIDEIVKVTPKSIIKPRVFLFKPDMSLFIGGLGRLDFLDGPNSIRVIVYSSNELPVTICDTLAAEEIYNYYLGSKFFQVPSSNDEERLKLWPKLEASQVIEIAGEEKHISACDIVLSSAGWIGVNLPKDLMGLFRAWTPEKRGIYVRRPALLPFGVNFRGPRVRHSLAYRLGDIFTNNKKVLKKK